MEFLCTTDITTTDKLSNKNFLLTINDLNKIVADNRGYNKVVMRKDFIEKYFPYDQVSEFIQNVGKINPNLIFEFDDYIVRKTVDSEILDILQKNLNKDDLILLLQFKEYDVIEAIYHLITAYQDYKTFELEGASIISSLREHIDFLNEQIELLNESLVKETINKRDVQDRLSVLINRINYTHNVGVDEKMLFVSNSNNYDKIIYIKEVTRVQYVDTLINVLQEILKLLYSMPTRIVVIEGYYANGKIQLYPTLKPHYCLTEKDVYSSDILMLGYQPKLFQDIMRNPSNISILIVLDRGGYTTPHLFSDNVEYLFTASNVNDIQDNVPKSRIISYKTDTMYIPHIKNYGDLSHGEQVQIYSSFKIVRQIVALLE